MIELTAKALADEHETEGEKRVFELIKELRKGKFSSSA